MVNEIAEKIDVNEIMLEFINNEMMIVLIAFLYVNNGVALLLMICWFYLNSSILMF